MVKAVTDWKGLTSPKVIKNQRSKILCDSQTESRVWPEAWQFMLVYASYPYRNNSSGIVE